MTLAADLWKAWRVLEEGIFDGPAQVIQSITQVQLPGTPHESDYWAPPPWHEWWDKEQHQAWCAEATGGRALEWIRLRPEHSKGLMRTAELLTKADGLGEAASEGRALVWMLACLSAWLEAGYRDQLCAMETRPHVLREALENRLADLGVDAVWDRSTKNRAPRPAANTLGFLCPVPTSLLEVDLCWAQIFLLALAATQAAGWRRVALRPNPNTAEQA